MRQGPKAEQIRPTTSLAVGWGIITETGPATDALTGLNPRTYY
jgi:hypothetical protein